MGSRSNLFFAILCSLKEKISSYKAIFNNHNYLIGSSFLHLMNDGFFVILYPLLPLIAREFNLPLFRVGILRATFSFSASFLQLPFALLSEKFWEMFLLVVGMGWVSTGLIAMGFTVTFVQLLLFSILSGLGGNIQHPVGSAFVSRIYDKKWRGSSIGVLNFSGDLGKIIFPLLISAILLSFDWRTCLIILGSMGLLFSFYSGWIFRKKKDMPYQKEVIEYPTGNRWGITSPARFILISLIGIIDGATRTVLLTFIPFLFLQKGIPASKTGFLLTILFTGGALGKLGCGFFADRLGNFKIILITEVLTGLSILIFPSIQPTILIPLLILCGFALNGTSTVLYKTIADLVTPEKRARGYGIFYSIYLGSEAFGPIIFGFIGDALGLRWIFFILAFITFLIIPLALPLRNTSHTDTVSAHLE
ncbi:Sialic acid transporter NanT [subsurface metagenome]